MSRSFKDQSIGLDSVINARELGGFVLPDGSVVRKGKLLRGGSLAKASDEDLRRLSDHFKVVHVFDFRTEGEVQRSPDKPVRGADNIWLPAIDENTETFGAASLPPQAYRHLEEFVVENCSNPMVQAVAKSMYPEMVLNEYTQLQYAAFLQLASTTRDGAIFWHCSQGKDRTGLGAAFLLAALGADRQTIMEDYEISNEFYADTVNSLIEKVIANGGGKDEIAVIRTFIGVNPEYFSAALDMAEMKYGTLLNYVKNALLLSDEDQRRLKENFLE